MEHTAFETAAIEQLQMAASLIQDLANGWPVRELATNPDQWREQVRELLGTMGEDLD